MRKGDATGSMRSSRASPTPGQYHSSVVSGRSRQPEPEYTNEVQIRVSFDANGNKARFYQNYRLAAVLPLVASR